MSLQVFLKELFLAVLEDYAMATLSFVVIAGGLFFLAMLGKSK